MRSTLYAHRSPPRLCNDGPIRVSIIGGSGYGGGELLRLLLGHPHVAIGQVTSESQAGNFVHSVHPNLRPTGRRQAAGEQPLRFTTASELAPCDVLFVALPHGEAQTPHPPPRHPRRPHR